MTKSIDIACTLGVADLAAQRRRWEQLMARALTGRAETADGLRLSFRPEAEDELRALVAVEPRASLLCTPCSADGRALGPLAPGH